MKFEEYKDYVQIIFAMNRNPSTKMSLIALLDNEDGLTVVQLNNIFDGHKTYENYQKIFERDIQSGLVEEFSARDTNGRVRKHFKINASELKYLDE